MRVMTITKMVILRRNIEGTKKMLDFREHEIIMEFGFYNEHTYILLFIFVTEEKKNYVQTKPQTPMKNGCQKIKIRVK